MSLEKYPIELELTNFCSLECKYCINKNLEKKWFIEEKNFLKILDYIFINRENILYLNLSWVGDIFLHPKINNFLIEIIKKFRWTGFKILLSTKWSFLTEQNIKILKKFWENNINLNISFGIFSMIPEIYDSFVNRKWSFEKTIRNIFFIKKAWISFSMELLLTNYSQNSIEIYKNFCQKLWVNPVFHNLHNFGGRIDISGEKITFAKSNCTFEENWDNENYFYENFSKCNFIPFIDYNWNFNLCSLDSHSWNILFNFNDVEDEKYINLIKKFPKYMGKNCENCSLNK